MFVIRTRFEAWAIIYSLAMGATTRGWHYVEVYPGVGGYLLFMACTGAVFLGGAKILDAVPSKRQRAHADRNEQSEYPDFQQTLQPSTVSVPAGVAEAMQQQVRVKWLFDEVTRAEPDGARSKIFFAVTSHNDNGPVASRLLQHGKEFETAHARHTLIHQHATRFEVRKGGNKLMPAFEPSILDSISSQQKAD